MSEIQMDKIIDNVKSNMAIESYFLQDKEINLLKNVLQKTITLDDAIDSVKRTYRVE